MNYFMIPGLKSRACKNSIKIIETCKQFFQLDLYKKTRRKEYVFARQVCMFLIYSNCGFTLKKTGSLFGQDHTTVMHAIKSIENYIYTKSFYECQQLYKVMVELQMAIPMYLIKAIKNTPYGIAKEVNG